MLLWSLGLTPPLNQKSKRWSCLGPRAGSQPCLPAWPGTSSWVDGREESLQEKAIKRNTKNGNVFQRWNNKMHKEFERGMISRMSWVALKLETLSVTDLGRGFTWGSALLSLPSCSIIQLVKNLQISLKKPQTPKTYHFLKFEDISSLPQEYKTESIWTVLSHFSQRCYSKNIKQLWPKANKVSCAPVRAQLWSPLCQEVRYTDEI